MLLDSKLRNVFATLAVTAATMSLPALAQEGSDPLVPTRQWDAPPPQAQPPNSPPPQATPAPAAAAPAAPEQPAATATAQPAPAAPAPQAATAPAATAHAQQAAPSPPHTGSIATRAAEPIRRGGPRPALAVANVNLRSAPGTNSQIVLTIPGGSTVRLMGCSGEWCAVTWNGRSGFAVARAFDDGLRQAHNYRAPPPRYPDEEIVDAGPPGPRVVYGPPPVVVYGPVYDDDYPPRYYDGPRWRRW